MSGRHIAFLGTAVPTSPHFETQLELMDKHAEAGDAITFIYCDGDGVCHCDVNQFHRRLTCWMCRGKRRCGLRALGREVVLVNLRELVEQAEAAQPFRARVRQDFPTVPELWNYTFDGYDAGEATLSTFISAIQQLEPDVIKHRDYLNRAVRSSVAIHKAIRHYLASRRCDTFYFFNGRGATHRGVLRACQMAGVECYTHERGSHVKKYLLTRNTVPHDIDYKKQRVEELWEQAAGDPNREAIARQFYEKRRKGVLTFTNITYLTHQQKGMLPEGWMDGRERIALLGATESERAALRNFYPKHIYESQGDGICRVIEGLAAANFQGVLAVRLHPNSHLEIQPLLARLRRYPYPFLRVIGPKDETDTYALIQTATKVATFWSTAGVEAAYLGLPVVLLGRATYEDVGATYNARTHEEAIRLLLEPLPPRGQAGLLKYGYYMASYGTSYERVELQGVHKCRVKGRAVRSPYLLQQLDKLLKHCGAMKSMLELEHPEHFKR